MTTNDFTREEMEIFKNRLKSFPCPHHPTQCIGDCDYKYSVLLAESHARLIERVRGEVEKRVEWISFETAQSIGMIPKHVHWEDFAMLFPSSVDEKLRLVRKKSLWNKAIFDILALPILQLQDKQKGDE